MDLIFDRTLWIIRAFMNMTARQVQHSTYTHNNFYNSLWTMAPADFWKLLMALIKKYTP